jgi:hypothetical protein
MNDLDLTLSDGLDIFYPLPVSSASANSSSNDRLNPVEIIRLDSPARDTVYTVTVSAHRLLVAQPYALVISGNLGHHQGGGEGSGKAAKKKKNSLFTASVVRAAELSLLSLAIAGIGNLLVDAFPPKLDPHPSKHSLEQPAAETETVE